MSAYSWSACRQEVVRMESDDTKKPRNYNHRYPFWAVFDEMVWEEKSKIHFVALKCHEVGPICWHSHWLIFSFTAYKLVALFSHILVPALVDCFCYLSKTTSTLWNFTSILHTVLKNMWAYSPKVVKSGVFPSAITNVWPSMSRQVGLARVICGGLDLFCQNVDHHGFVGGTETAISCCQIQWNGQFMLEDVFQVDLAPCSISCNEPL